MLLYRKSNFPFERWLRNSIKRINISRELAQLYSEPTSSPFCIWLRFLFLFTFSSFLLLFPFKKRQILSGMYHLLRKSKFMCKSMFHLLLHKVHFNFGLDVPVFHETPVPARSHFLLHKSGLLWTLLTLSMEISKDGDSKTSLDNLVCCWTSLVLKSFSLP